MAIGQQTTTVKDISIEDHWYLDLGWEDSNQAEGTCGYRWRVAHTGTIYCKSSSGRIGLQLYMKYTRYSSLTGILVTVIVSWIHTVHILLDSSRPINCLLAPVWHASRADTCTQTKVTVYFRSGRIKLLPCTPLSKHRKRANKYTIVSKCISCTVCCYIQCAGLILHTQKGTAVYLW